MDKYFIKKAEKNDMDLLYKWVCDDDVRKNSFKSEPISYEEHKKWYSSKLDSEMTFIFIYYWNSIPVGQIRVEQEDNNAVISYSIDKNYRKQGHGVKMISLLEDEICINYPNINKLTAYIKSDNIASIKVFKKLKYKKKNDAYEYSKILSSCNKPDIM